MPTTAAVIVSSRTQESVVIQVDNDGVADVVPFQITRAVLLGQLLDGPLRERLRRTPDWTVFNLGGAADDFIRLTLIDGGLNVTLQAPSGIILDFLANAMEFSLTFGGAELAPCNILVELRAEHSNER